MLQQAIEGFCDVGGSYDTLRSKITKTLVAARFAPPQQVAGEKSGLKPVMFGSAEYASKYYGAAT